MLNAPGIHIIGKTDLRGFCDLLAHLTSTFRRGSLAQGRKRKEFVSSVLPNWSELLHQVGRTSLAGGERRTAARPEVPAGRQGSPDRGGGHSVSQPGQLAFRAGPVTAGGSWKPGSAGRARSSGSPGATSPRVSRSTCPPGRGPQVGSAPSPSALGSPGRQPQRRTAHTQRPFRLSVSPARQGVSCSDASLCV